MTINELIARMVSEMKRMYFTTELRQMMSYDIVKNISKLKKQVAKFRETVYTKDRSKCLPLADGAGYK